jgi:hypothetical protein
MIPTLANVLANYAYDRQYRMLSSQLLRSEESEPYREGIDGSKTGIRKERKRKVDHAPRQNPVCNSRKDCPNAIHKSHAGNSDPITSTAGASSSR